MKAADLKILKLTFANYFNIATAEILVVGFISTSR